MKQKILLFFFPRQFLLPSFDMLISFCSCFLHDRHWSDIYSDSLLRAHYSELKVWWFLNINSGVFFFLFLRKSICCEPHKNYLGEVAVMRKSQQISLWIIYNNYHKISLKYFPHLRQSVRSSACNLHNVLKLTWIGYLRQWLTDWDNI